jgi:protein-tyrosine phosphatase
MSGPETPLPPPRSTSSDTYRVSMVCLGNICRSPMAAVVLDAQLRARGIAEEVVVSSAGTGDWHVGLPADPRTLAALRRRGYDGHDHRAQQITSPMIASQDLVLAMDEANLADLRSLSDPADHTRIRMLRTFDPQPSPDATVPDPYFGDETDFEHALDLVETACHALADQLHAAVSVAR